MALEQNCLHKITTLKRALSISTLKFMFFFFLSDLRKGFTSRWKYSTTFLSSTRSRLISSPHLSKPKTISNPNLEICANLFLTHALQLCIFLIWKRFFGVFKLEGKKWQKNKSRMELKLLATLPWALTSNHPHAGCLLIVIALDQMVQTNQLVTQNFHGLKNKEKRTYSCKGKSLKTR